MNRLRVGAVILAICVSPGCIKTSSQATVKNDGSATVTMRVACQAETLHSIRTAPDSCTCWNYYQIHEKSIPAARREFSAFESEFDPEQLKTRWSRLGLQVSKASMSESGGWKTLEIEASTESTAAYYSKLANMTKLFGPDEYLTALPWYLHTRKLLPKFPRFHKTADPTVVKVTIPVGDSGSEIAGLSDLTEAQRNNLNVQLRYLRSNKAFDIGEIRVSVKLPGTIISVENATKDGTDGVRFEVRGQDVTPETIASQAKAKGMITAMLKIDPAAFKIPLEEG